MTATATNTSTNRGRFVWAELLTSDVAAAKEFYGKVVGWGTQEMPGGPMPYTLWMAGEMPSAGLMALHPKPGEAGPPPHWIGYNEVPDVDATVEQVTKLGGKILVPAMTVEQAGRFAVAQDPWGAVFGFMTSSMPLGDEQDPRPLEFSWHELTTDDLPAAISFYEAIFGWKKQSEFDMGDMGTYYMYGRDRFTYGGMMKRSGQMPPASWLHYASVRDSADAAAERAKQAGGTVILGPMEVPGGDRIAVILDPQGAAFAVHSKAAK